MDVVDAMLAYLIKEDWYEIRHNFLNHGRIGFWQISVGGSQLLNQTIDDEGAARFNVVNVPDGFNVSCLNLFIDKFDEKDLKGFVEFIKSDPPENDDLYWRM